MGGEVVIPRDGQFFPFLPFGLDVGPSLVLDNDIGDIGITFTPFIGALGYKKALRGELVDALTLDANYVRRTDAEEHWKGA